MQVTDVKLKRYHYRKVYEKISKVRVITFLKLKFRNMMFYLALYYGHFKKKEK